MQSSTNKHHTLKQNIRDMKLFSKIPWNLHHWRDISGTLANTHKSFLLQLFPLPVPHPVLLRGTPFSHGHKDFSLLHQRVHCST